jgi:c-di-GMP-binding flagellar brake protein YcgR
LQPKINQTLFLQLNSIDEEESKQEYKTRIADIQEQYIAMEIPIHEKTGRLKRFYAGDELSVYFISEGGVKNYFTTSVLGFKEDVVRLVVIKRPQEEAITQVQRRNFLRVPAELEVAVRVSDNIRFLGITEDVSGGGISFFCEKQVPIQQGNETDCWLLLMYKNGKVDHVSFKGELVRVKPLETRQQLVMLRFTDIKEGERQKIIRYCFERQLDFRKK